MEHSDEMGTKEDPGSVPWPYEIECGICLGSGGLIYNMPGGGPLPEPCYHCSGAGFVVLALVDNGPDDD